MVVLIKL